MTTHTLESVLAMLTPRKDVWPQLSKPVYPLDNTRLAQAQSKATKDNQRAELTELPEYHALTRRVCAAREIA
jgi:hypothetical protein